MRARAASERAIYRDIIVRLVKDSEGESKRAGKRESVG